MRQSIPLLSAGWFMCLWVLEPAQANQTKEWPIREPIRKKQWGTFLNSECFSLKNTENSQSRWFSWKGVFVYEFSLFFQGEHPEFRKAPHFRDLACELAIFWFPRAFSFLEDPNLLKLRSLDATPPFVLSDKSIWAQWTQMLQMLWSQD